MFCNKVSRKAFSLRQCAKSCQLKEHSDLLLGVYMTSLNSRDFPPPSVLSSQDYKLHEEFHVVIVEAKQEKTHNTRTPRPSLAHLFYPQSYPYTSLVLSPTFWPQQSKSLTLLNLIKPLQYITSLYMLSRKQDTR